MIGADRLLPLHAVAHAAAGHAPCHRQRRRLDEGVGHDRVDGQVRGDDHRVLRQVRDVAGLLELLPDGDQIAVAAQLHVRVQPRGLEGGAIDDEELPERLHRQREHVAVVRVRVVGPGVLEPLEPEGRIAGVEQIQPALIARHERIGCLQIRSQIDPPLGRRAPLHLRQQRVDADLRQIVVGALGGVPLREPGAVHGRIAQEDDLRVRVHLLELGLERGHGRAHNRLLGGGRGVLRRRQVPQSVVAVDEHDLHLVGGFLLLNTGGEGRQRQGTDQNRDEASFHYSLLGWSIRRRRCHFATTC